VNTFDSNGPMRQMVGVATIIRETSHRGCGNFGWEFPSRNAFFCWALILTISLLTVSGCSRYKEELEGAKQQIEKLSTDVTKLTEETTRLKQETGRLSDESKALSDKNAKMQRDLDDLNKAKGALSAENKELQKKNKVADEEIASLNREKGRLEQEIEELKKRAAQMAPPPPSPAGMPTEVGPQSAKQSAELSPCDAVIAFMKASEAVVRQQKGTERTKSLEQVKQQFAPKMKGAPEKAIKAAENWVKEGSKFWDQFGGEGAFSLLQLRNTVLEACGKSPDATGFK
jgi:outer membrane murein-binding lipoprotein Lpp